MTLHFSHMGFTDGLTFIMLNLHYYNVCRVSIIYFST